MTTTSTISYAILGLLTVNPWRTTALVALQRQSGGGIMRSRTTEAREIQMAGVVKKSFGSADEVRTPDKTRLEIVDLGGIKAARMTAQPGWRWSACIKPVVGTESCQVHHVGTVVGGSMHIVHNDGTEQDIAEGDAYVIEPGHDAWVTGDQPFVGFEFDSSAAGSYAKPS